MTKLDLTGAFNRTVVLTGGRIVEFVDLLDPIPMERVLQAIKITGIPVTWWRDSRFMGEFLGRGFGRLWYAEYRK